MTDKELIEKIAHWRKHDFGACACLGNCKRCGYHMCHGCLCFVLDELESRADERQKVLAEIEGWLVDEDTSTGFAIDGGKWTQKQVHDKSRDALRAELRARLAQMKGGK